MKKISIITVVFNAEKDIEVTIRSVIEQRNYYKNIEYIIIDGGSNDKTLEIIKRYSDNIDVIVSEPDKGIYDAMNKGLEKSTGDAHLFINAGDYFVGNVLGGVTVAPIFFPVVYRNIFNQIKQVKISSEKSRIPNCHQGILFENKNIRYSLEYKICSDYDYFLNHNYTSKITTHSSIGFIYFSPGYSTINYKQRDIEAFKIREKNFGIANALMQEIKISAKRLIRYYLSK